MSHNENSTMDKQILTSEQVKQAAYSAAAGSMSAIRAADIAYHRSLRDAAIAQGVSPAQFITALKELGVNS